MLAKAIKGVYCGWGALRRPEGPLLGCHFTLRIEGDQGNLDCHISEGMRRMGGETIGASYSFEGVVEHPMDGPADHTWLVMRNSQPAILLPFSVEHLCHLSEDEEGAVRFSFSRSNLHMLGRPWGADIKLGAFEVFNFVISERVGPLVIRDPGLEQVCTEWYRFSCPAMKRDLWFLFHDYSSLELIRMRQKIRDSHSGLPTGIALLSLEPGEDIETVYREFSKLCFFLSFAAGTNVVCLHSELWEVKEGTASRSFHSRSGSVGHGKPMFPVIEGLWVGQDKRRGTRHFIEQSSGAFFARLAESAGYLTALDLYLHSKFANVQEVGMILAFIALERLLELMQIGSRSEKVNKAKDLLHDLTQWLDCRSESEQLKNRVKGLVGMLRYPSLPDRLRNGIRDLELDCPKGIELSDLGKCRNGLIHAGAIPEEYANKEWEMMLGLWHLFDQFFLRCVGYEGWYLDCTVLAGPKEIKPMKGRVTFSKLS